MSLLAIGIVCLDEILQCPHYPVEDTLIHAHKSLRHKGGNAANSMGVLGQLAAVHHKPRPRLLTTLACDESSRFVEDELCQLGCDLEPAVPRIAQATLPKSWIVLSGASGLRTIIHLRDLRELTLLDVQQVSLSQYSWVHIEGRTHVEDFNLIAEHVKHSPGQRTVSVELETPRPIDAYRRMIAVADVLFLSREFAELNSWMTPRDAILGVKAVAKPETIIFCAWGTYGADAYDGRHDDSSSSSSSAPVDLLHADAVAQECVVDTNGAGDTFNAAVMFALWSGRSVCDALHFGCAVAGRKVAQESFDGLGDTPLPT